MPLKLQTPTPMSSHKVHLFGLDLKHYLPKVALRFHKSNSHLIFKTLSDLQDFGRKLGLRLTLV
ncbi:unnamed protein product [Prunus armeniaca]|uniref:Uncharacterized protein n=1 Tax=Prunus armeniaca TaxID=36596 RepID=A0A6J5VJD7_PRUAR|nr:unnamed protein product [Prunus armeniaca]CAB4319664.1 unnamed protein product [Prunus armeniaca]